MTIIEFARTLRLAEGEEAEDLIPTPRDEYPVEETEVRVSDDGETIIVLNRVSGYCSLARNEEFGIGDIKMELTYADFRRLGGLLAYKVEGVGPIRPKRRSQIRWFKTI